MPVSTNHVSILLGDGTGPLFFTLGAMQEVPVKVSPAGPYVVRFALADDAGDAFLDKSEAMTDADGSASVVLTAPSSPVMFHLRASVVGSGVSAELLASANTPGNTLLVVPVYAGTRTVTSWFATAQTDVTCDPGGAVPPTDGMYQNEVEANEPVPVPHVPEGKPLRVTVRAGHFAGGCTDVPAFAVGERRSVSVTVTDRPLEMTNVRIPVVLGIDENDAWTTGFSSLSALMASKAVGSSKRDASALLDEMLEATPYLWQDAFVYQRLHLGWDDRVEHIFAGGSTAIRDRLNAWVTAGLSTLATNAVAGTLTSPGAGAGTATFAVTQVAGAAPKDSGFPDSIPLTWTSAAGDEVLFGGAATWQPSRLAATLASAAAADEFPSATSASNALSLALSCEQIGKTLAGDAAAIPALNCDAACLSSRCEDALDVMWTRAKNAVTGKAALHIAASGHAAIDESAHPVGFVGTWVGDVSLGAAAIRVSGPAKSATPGAEPR